jgi:hypothetical protein
MMKLKKYIAKKNPIKKQKMMKYIKIILWE